MGCNDVSMLGLKLNHDSKGELCNWIAIIVSLTDIFNNHFAFCACVIFQNAFHIGFRGIAHEFNRIADLIDFNWVLQYTHYSNVVCLNTRCPLLLALFDWDWDTDK